MIRQRPAPSAARMAVAPLSGRAHEQQVRDVRTCDQQHEADRAEQHQHP